MMQFNAGFGEFKMVDYIKSIREAILNYDEDSVKRLVTEAIEDGMDPLKILDEGLTPAIREVGDKFGKEEIFLTELLLAANVCVAGAEIAKQKLLEEKQKVSKPKGVIVLGTVQGDVHNIGKDIFKVLLEISGYQVHDLGIDVPAENFVKKAIEVKADFVASSALLTTTRPQQKLIEEKLKEAEIRRKVKTIIGGGATDKNWAKEVGCDFYATDAIEGVKIIRKICEGQQ